MRKSRNIALIAVVLLALAWQVVNRSDPPAAPTPSVTESIEHSLPSFLPDEAASTLQLIERGGPFPHRQDGAIFHNREGHLPRRPDGYYREYTVTTPGSRDRGARRIVTGGQPPEIYYYTADHYRSFRRFEVSP